METKIQPTKTKVVTKKSSLSEIQDLIKEYSFSVKTFFVAYLDHSVIIGNLKEGSLLYWDKQQGKEVSLAQSDFSFLQKLRIFNTKEELFIWNSNRGKQEFSSRYRKDDDGEEKTESLPMNQILFGTRDGKLSQSAYTSIKENRGTEIILPFELQRKISPDVRIAVQVNYYIDYNELGIAQYTDARFVKFVIINKNGVEEI